MSSPLRHLLLVLLTSMAPFVGAAESNLLTNGALILEGERLNGWRPGEAGLALTAGVDGLPMGVETALIMTTAAREGNHGWIAQRLPAPTGIPRLQVSARLRADVAGAAYLQVKRYAAGKEIDRQTIGSADTAWSTVTGTVPTEGVDQIEVLLRWRGDGRYAGSRIGFADVKLLAATVEVLVVAIGDSTVQDYPASDTKRGWGQILPDLLAPGVALRNLAAGGRSTSTFRSEGRWEAALALKPAVVLIQFGHNDSHEPDRPESTPPPVFAENLRAYVREARAAGIVPILVTPPPRRHLASDGAACPPLVPYAEAVRTVAADLDVPLIDLFAALAPRLQELGNEGSIALYCSEKDRSHFSVEGATFLAKTVADALRAQGGHLARLVREP